MARLGDVTIFNEKESGTDSVSITEYDVERGAKFADHVRQDTPTFRVSGFIFDDDWVLTREKLINDMNAGKFLKYVGKSTANDVVIEDVNVDADKTIANGIAINISLRKIRVTKTAYRKAPPKTIPARKNLTEAGEKKPTGPRTDTEFKYHTIKAGDTYWYCSQKYAVTVDWLMKNNPWDARKLPIGGKMKIGQVG